MEVMRVKRHGLTKLIVFLTFFILFFLLVPTRFEPVGKKNVTIEETYKVTEEIPKIIPQETIKTVTEPTKMEIEVRQSKSRKKTIEGKNYIEQDIVFIIPEPYDNCIYFNYTLFRDNDKVNKERKKTCFENQQSEITVQELYSGNIEKYYYKIDVPTIEIIKEVEKTIIENVTVTEFEEVTKLRNVTKEVDSEEVQRVNWITGYRWWFLD